MASAGLLALLDDIATVLDDVAILSKVAAKKTAGVLGDDLALNAEQVSGVKAEREIPVVWAVAKGSAKNKLILVPLALLLSALAPWLITPLMVMGGSFLCFEGFEKIAHKLFPHDQKDRKQDKTILERLADPTFDMVAFEEKKIKGAIRTDFILSAEIVVIALGTVQETSLLQQVLVVSFIAAVITIGVYGLVAAIVKLDDAGLALMKNEGGNLWGGFCRVFGEVILKSCPVLMKTLSVVGTAAMFLVGGGILVHSIPYIHPMLHSFSHLPIVVTTPEFVASSLFNAITGIIAGGVIVIGVTLATRILPALKGE